MHLKKNLNRERNKKFTKKRWEETRLDKVSKSD